VQQQQQQLGQLFVFLPENFVIFTAHKKSLHTTQAYTDKN
jgi:hypothetical protein